ncbi:MAG TPA: hypothetical protein VFZ61_33715 [Polyangiales bacterium]
MKQQSSQFPFAGFIALTFTVLKLCDVIDWSWWWVLSPLWITFVVAFLAFTLIALAEARGEVRRQRRMGMRR